MLMEFACFRPILRLCPATKAKFWNQKIKLLKLFLPKHVPNPSIIILVPNGPRRSAGNFQTIPAPMPYSQTNPPYHSRKKKTRNNDNARCLGGSPQCSCFPSKRATRLFFFLSATYCRLFFFLGHILAKPKKISTIKANCDKISWKLQQNMFQILVNLGPLMDTAF